MKTLTLLRHAKSGWDDADRRDFDRRLNAKGARAARTMGQHMRHERLAFDRVVASPAVRVMETLDAVERGYGQRLSAEWDRDLYLAPAGTLVEHIRALDGAHERVLFVGHNPGIEDLVLLLAARGDGGLRGEVERKYPTATLAELTFADGWAGAGEGCAHLTRFVRPRDLDPSLGPDEE